MWLKLRNNAQEEDYYTVIVQGVAYGAYNLTKIFKLELCKLELLTSVIYK